MNGIILEKDFLSENEVEALNELYQELDNVKDDKLFYFEAFNKQYSISMKQRDILMKISEIENRAVEKALNYYAQNIDDLIFSIEKEIEFLIILEAKKESFLFFVPFIDLVEKNAPEKYKKLIASIKDKITHKERLINSVYGQLIIKAFNEKESF